MVRTSGINLMKNLTARLLGIAAPVIAAGLLTACSGIAVQPAAPQGGINIPVDNSTAVAKTGSVALPNVSVPTGQSVAENINLLLKAEDYDRDIENARSALDSSPSDESLRQKLADAYIARAWFYKIKRLTTYTSADLFKAVEVAPNYYRSHYEIGRFHNNQWQFGIGLFDLNKALALKPDFAPAYSERAYSNYKNQNFDAALSDVNKSIELDPSASASYCTRSLIYVATGKTALALEDTDTAVRIAPSDASSYYYRGLVYEAMGKSDLAIADFNTVFDLSSDDLLRARANAELQKLRK
jgi:tetratricopeptide (TPR) repeat protein